MAFRRPCRDQESEGRMNTQEVLAILATVIIVTWLILKGGKR